MHDGPLAQRALANVRARTPIYTEHLGDSVESLVETLERVDALAGVDVDACAELATEYDNLRRWRDTQGRRSDIVRELLAHGLQLRTVALYLGYDSPREIVYLIVPPALKPRWKDVVAADVDLRQGTSVEHVAARRHLPLGFVDQLHGWQRSCNDIAAKRMCAQLILEDGLGVAAALSVVQDTYGIAVPYHFAYKMQRGEDTSAVRARYGLTLPASG